MIYILLLQLNRITNQPLGDTTCQEAGALVQVLRSAVNRNRIVNILADEALCKDLVYVLSSHPVSDYSFLLYCIFARH